jgi:hypothetical protein
MGHPVLVAGTEWKIRGQEQKPLGQGVKAVEKSTFSAHVRWCEHGAPVQYSKS